MHVAMYYHNRDVRLEEMPTPQIGSGEVLVQVEACGICGSDVLEWYRIDRAPLVLGHEIAGRVAAVGEEVEQYHPGDRVCVAHHVPCNTCYYCRRGHHTACETLRHTQIVPGGFAQYIRVKPMVVDRGIFPLPEEVSFAEASFAEPLACVLRAQRQARIQPGDSVLVMGSGTAGLLHMQLARALGAGRIVATDTVEYRRKAARQWGADAVLSAEEDVPARLRQVNDGQLADLVVVCTGAPSALTQGLQCAERGGTVLLFAPTPPGVTLPLTINDLFFRGITLTTSYAGAPADYAVALELIRHHRVQVAEMVTHRLGLAETGLGFQLVARAQNSLKVIVEPNR